MESGAGLTGPEDAASPGVPRKAVMIYCKHCGRPIVRRARRRRQLVDGRLTTVVGFGGRLPNRGLCQPCYNDSSVRPHYPLSVGPTDDPVRKADDGASSPTVTVRRDVGRPLPPGPTDAMPGSDEKLEVLEERARLGYALWHPDDLTVDGQMLAEFGFTMTGLVQAGGDRSTRTRCLEVLGPTAGLNVRPRKTMPEDDEGRAKALAASKERSNRWAFPDQPATDVVAT